MTPRPRLTAADRDPRGGLTASGRAKYNRAGARLRPGVLEVHTLDDMRRKGSFLRRFYARDAVPALTTPTGRATRYALAAQAWGERAPRTLADVRALAAKGARLLAAYHRGVAHEKRSTPRRRAR